MTARHLLERLDDLGVRLTVAGEKLRYESRGGEIDPELLAEMRAQRDDLASILTRRAELTWPPARDRDDADGPDRRGPLTIAQKTLWATSHFVDDGTYNLSGALRLRGRLDEDAWEEALADLHRRHPSLRTVFPQENGEPVQCVLREAAPSVAVHDLREQGAGAFDECLRMCADLTDRLVPLDEAPPVRMHLFRPDHDDRVFFVILHHIIGDAISTAVLLDDLAECYNARCLGKAVDAPDTVDMVDCARWEAELLACGDLSSTRRYWRDRMQGAVFGKLPLPPPIGDAGRRERGGAHTATVDAHLTAAVRTLAATTRSSTFLVVSAAVAATLARYTGRDDMVIGMPLTRRDRSGLEDLVGLLLDTVPVRLEVGADLPFTGLVRRTRAAVLGAVGNTRVSSDARGLFNVLLTDAGIQLSAPRFQGLEAELVDVPQVGAKYDLNVLVRDGDEALRIDVEFDRQAISARDVAAMTATVRRILSQGCAHPNRRTSDLAAAPFGEVGTGATGADPERVPGAHDSLVSRLAEVAQAQGGAVAVSHDGVTMTYRELVDLADTAARGLQRRGIGLGDIVAISLPRSIDLVVAMAGVLGSGAGMLVLDDSWPEARQTRVLADAGARLTIDEVALRELADQGRTAPPCAPVPGQAIAYVIYTSGSTGQPKGVQVTHHNLLSLVDGTSHRFGFGSADTWSLFHSCSFDVAMWETFGCLLHGGRLVVVPKWTTREPGAFLRLLERERVTVLCQTPSALATLVPVLPSRPDSVSSVRHVVLAGEALERRLVDQWYAAAGDGARLVNMYGITETTVHSSWRWTGPTDDDTPESEVGGPIPGTALHLLHDNGTAVLDRCVGEIYVGGAGVTLGYLGRPRETALRYVPDPFSSVPGARLYRSGDLARRNGSSLAYIARRDAQVQVNGFRVELSEVEEALAGHPGVGAAAAATVRDDAGARIVAVVVPAGGADLSPADIVRTTRATLPGYMVPSVVRVVADLPLTANGKLDRAVVVALAGEGRRSPRPADATPPEGEAETILLDVFREVFDDDTMSTAEDFFEVGGDSMRAIRLVGLALERGLLLSVRDVYAAPGMKELAGRAVRRGDEPASGRSPFSLVPADAAETLPAGVEDAYPMTALQLGMIYHRELAPDSTAYHMVLSYRVGGRLDPAAFGAAVQAVTDAHPLLRASFDLAHAAGPLQRIHTGLAAPVSFEDLRHLGHVEQEARVRQVVDTELATVFDLDRPPLFRLLVLVRSDGDYQVVFSHHHAILDGWSVNVFVEDLLRAYQAALDGEGARLDAPLRSSFADYVALEQAAVDDPAHREFWRARTAGGPLLVAPDRTGEPVLRLLHDELPEGTYESLREVASRVGVSVKALLLAAHFRVLAWVTGRNDLVTGLTTNCRPELPDADRLVGLFLNELPMRVELGAQSWADLARHVRRDELDMMEHRWFPHALIQEGFGQPLFDSGFNFTDFHPTRELVRGGALEILDADEIESTHFALSVNYTVDVRTRELRLLLEHDATVLSQSTAALVAEALRRAVAAIIADVDGPSLGVALPGVSDVIRSLATTRERPPATPAPRAEPAVDAATFASLEASVREVWEEVLGVSALDPADSFFDLGGSSLTAMQVVSRLRARHGRLRMGTFVETPTIEAVARALAASNAVETPAPTGMPRSSYPLSGAQQQMWLLATKLPGLPLFGMPGALRIDGPLDLDLLDRTFAVLIGRHEALRTSFTSTDGPPQQVVAPSARLDLERVGLSEHPDPLAECERRMAVAIREPVALDKAPLLRAVVYRIGPDVHVLYVNIHHMVSDGWSLELLLRDASETYHALAAGEAVADRPAPLGSGQLAAARAEWLTTPEASEQREYWLDRLAPPWSSLTSRPTSRLPALGDDARLLDRFRSATCRRRLDPETTASLREAARRHGLTEFMVVLAGYAATLRRWSGQPDIRIATMLANRTEPHTDEVVGLLANTAVLRLIIDDDRDHRANVDRARAASLEAYDHQELPFEDVLAAVGDRHEPGPLFEVMLVMQEEIEEVAAGGALQFAPYTPEGGALAASIAPTTSAFILAATTAREGLLLDLQYQTAATGPALAEELLDDIGQTIVAVVRSLSP